MGNSVFTLKWLKIERFKYNSIFPRLKIQEIRKFYEFDLTKMLENHTNQVVRKDGINAVAICVVGHVPAYRDLSEILGEPIGDASRPETTDYEPTCTLTNFIENGGKLSNKQTMRAYEVVSEKEGERYVIRVVEVDYRKANKDYKKLFVQKPKTDIKYIMIDAAGEDYDKTVAKVEEIASKIGLRGRIKPGIAEQGIKDSSMETINVMLDLYVEKFGNYKKPAA